MASSSGSLGNVSSGRTPGRAYKTILKIEKAVRLEAMGLTDDQIAEHLGYADANSFRVSLKQLPEYQSTRVRITTGVISELDDELASNTEYLRATINNSIPRALQVLVNNLNSSDEKVAMTAAESLLDRHGKLAKVSRIGLPSEDQGGVGVKSFKQEIADELASEVSAINKGASSNGNSQNSSNQTNGASTTQP
jgi:hypothetical protein